MTPNVDTKKIKPNPEQAFFPKKSGPQIFAFLKKIREIRYASVDDKPNQTENPSHYHDEPHRVERVMCWVSRLFVWS
jgi:hypothetical protein